MLPLQEHWLCRPVGFSSTVLPLLDRKSADPIPFTFQHNTDLTVVQALFWKFTLGNNGAKKECQGHYSRLYSKFEIRHSVICIGIFGESWDKSQTWTTEIFFSPLHQFHYVVVLAVLELYVVQAGLDLRITCLCWDKRCVPPLLTQSET